MKKRLPFDSATRPLFVSALATTAAATTTKMSNKSVRIRIALVTAAAFLFAYASSITAAAIASTQASAATFHSDAATTATTTTTTTCARVTRYADYAVVNLVVGSPSRNLRVMLRTDQIIADSATQALTLFSSDLLSSHSLRCDDVTSVCTDVALLEQHRQQRRHEVSFAYAQTALYSFAIERSLGLDGALFMTSNTIYQLSDSSLCWHSGATRAANTTTDTTATTVINALAANQSLTVQTAEGDAWTNSPASNCSLAAGVSATTLFPYAAAVERSWLALASSSVLFESSVAKLSDRREVVERGLQCAPESAERDVYTLDCAFDAASSCRQTASFPFRRVSDSELRFTIEDSLVTVTATPLPSLSRLATRVDGQIFTATMRSIVLLIVAFVVYSRSSSTGASSRRHIETALRISQGSRFAPNSHSMLDVFFDGVVGILAVAARLTIVLFQRVGFEGDGASAVVVAEFIGIAASASHFFLRYFVLKSDEPAIERLGGSMAIIDAAVAALVAVSDTPLLTPVSFVAVSRLLVAILVALFVFARCVFAVASCVLLAQIVALDRKRFNVVYAPLLIASALLWLAQGIVANVVFVFLFVVPQTYSVLRAAEYNEHALSIISLLVYTIVFSTGLPAVTDAATKLVKKA